ncbi:hypothetical protein [Planktotalea sp.]|uniref:hypothetical protein n=1 Tax=Planktotalea sp. TaxID=2029877 RepID=UPI0032972E46
MVISSKIFAAAFAAALAGGTLMAGPNKLDPIAFEFSQEGTPFPDRWLLKHGTLPAGAQVVLKLEDGTPFSGVQFYGTIGDISAGNHQIIAESDAISGRTSLRVVPYIWVPNTGLRAALPEEQLSLEPITLSPISSN